jgi:hypothetical protein
MERVGLIPDWRLHDVVEIYLKRRRYRLRGATYRHLSL